MKKYLLLFVLLCAVALSNAQNSQILKIVPNDRLTPADRKNYLLRVDQSKIRSFDSNYYYYPQIGNNKIVHYIIVPVKFTNTTNVTLKYVTWGCSWDEFYLTSLKSIKCVTWPCEKNWYKVLKLAPHQSTTVKLSLYTAQRDIKNYAFSVGMILRKDTSLNYHTARKDQQDVLWSNPIQIPAR